MNNPAENENSDNTRERTHPTSDEIFGNVMWLFKIFIVLAFLGWGMEVIGLV